MCFPPRVGGPLRGLIFPAFVAALLVCSTACREKADPPSVDEAKPVAQQPQQVESAQSNMERRYQAPQVVVTDTGKRPRRELRYVLESGVAERYSSEFTIDYGENRSIRTKVVTRVTHVEPKVEGGYVLEFELEEYESVRIFGENRDVIPSSPMMRSRKGRIETDSQCHTSLVSIDSTNIGLAAPLLEGVIENYRFICEPLPTEAVGVGAKWQVVYDSKYRGITSIVRRASVVESMSETGVTLQFDRSENAKPGTVDTPAGGLLQESKTTEGSGSQQINLSRVAPHTYSYRGQVTSSVRRGGPEQPEQNSTYAVVAELRALE